MPNMNFENVAAARYHLICPLCKQTHGHIELTEQSTFPHLLHVNCKTCGLLTTANFEWDFATPSGLTMSQHGQSLAEILQVWMADNPVDVITQLARLGRDA